GVGSGAIQFCGEILPQRGSTTQGDSGGAPREHCGRLHPENSNPRIMSTVEHPHSFPINEQGLTLWPKASLLGRIGATMTSKLIVPVFVGMCLLGASVPATRDAKGGSQQQSLESNEDFNAKFQLLPTTNAPSNARGTAKIESQSEAGVQDGTMD